MYKVKLEIIILLLSVGTLFPDTSFPTPPSIPEIMAVSDNEYVRLMWDHTAENSIDSLTSYADFEGYRIYRSSDGGMTWCDFGDRMFDFT